MHSWKPSYIFRLLHPSQMWAIERSSTSKFQIKSANGDYLLHYSFNGWRLTHQSSNEAFLLTTNGIQLNARPWGLGEIVIDSYGKKLTLPGVSERVLHELMTHLTQAEEAMLSQLGEFHSVWRAVAAWESTTRQQARQELAHRGWVSSKFQAAVAENRPRELDKFLDLPLIAEMIEERPANYVQTLQFWAEDHPHYFQFLNEAHIDKAVKESAHFFNTVEKSPLTLEQRIPVTCSDNRVLVVASAGSGKTSCLVAKAGYSLLHGHSLPSSTLLLAFNREAADELRNRVIERLKPLGLPAHKVQVKTFHSLSLEIIESVTGAKPVIAPWTQSDQGKIAQILRFLKQQSMADDEFRENMVLMSYAIGLDLPPLEQEKESPDTWDESLNTGFQSLLDESLLTPLHVVVANWLTVHGVSYRYRPSPADCTLSRTAGHIPTFYLPESKLYLEIWDIDKNSLVSQDCAPIRHLIQHARSVHESEGTIKQEYFNDSLRSGADFEELKAILVRSGHSMKPKEPSEIKGRKPLELDHLANIMKSFITHIKANRWEPQDLFDNLRSPAYNSGFKYRSTIFLKMMIPVYNLWCQTLANDGHIDFDDMVNSATDMVNQGYWPSPFKLILVDEFQDTSRSRAGLLKALSADDESCLFCVGDDWQSINGFAGADVSVMSRFDKLFGNSTHFKLETTFRCPQSLCDVSTQFISKNPSQIPKTVVSAKADVFEPVRLLLTPMSMQPDLALLATMTSELNRLERLAVDTNQHFSVMVLGRYNYDKYFADKQLLPQYERLNIRFLSVHQAKGLEADFVIVPRMSSAAYAFPCQTKDDSALQLATACPDPYPFAEERRLFYVAITRAKRGVTLCANEGLESSFFVELNTSAGIPIQRVEATQSSAITCPACNKGFLLEKKGKGAKGPYSFYSCNRFPVCKQTVSTADVDKLRKSLR